MNLGVAKTLREAIPGWGQPRAAKMLDGLPVAVWEVRGAPDSAGYLSYLSPCAAELFGLPVEPDLGTTAFWDHVVHRDDRDQLLAVLRQAWTSGRPVVTRVRCLRASGEPFRAQVNATAVTDADDRAIGVRGVVVDLSCGQRRVHRRLADADILGILHWNSEGRITGANDVFLAMLGYTRDDLMEGRIKWDELTPPEYADQDHTAQRQLRQCGAATPSEKEFYHRDGSRVHVLVGTATFDDASGDGMSSVLNLTPYKCRVREEQTLASLSQHALATGSSSILPFAAPSIRYAVRADAVIIFVRREREYRVAACDGLLAEARAAFASGFVLPAGIEHWDLGRPVPWMDMLAQQGMVAGVTLSIGEERGVQTVLGVYSRTPRRFSAEELTFLQGAANLLSSAVVHKQTAEALAAQEQRSQQNLKLEALGRLAGGIAHDFNNLLTAILGYADLAVEKSSGSCSELEQVRHAATSAAELVRQLLAFSRQQVLAPRQLNLNTVVSDVERILRRLITKDIDLVCNLSPRPVIVNADAVQLEQVIMNLVLNARDAIRDHGQITVSVATIPGEDLAQLSVADTGVGMDETTRERIFEPFFTTKELGKGTGLGLATVHGIVQQSGGTIAVQSAPGCGTVFTVQMPLAGKPVSRASASSRPAPTAGTEAVLLVDDEEYVRRSLTAGLGAFGYEVFPAASPADAISIASSATRRIDALVTDMMMPLMDGTTLATHIRALRPNIRTLFISGHPLGEEHLADQFIAKPFHCRELAARLRKALDVKVK